MRDHQAYIVSLCHAFRSLIWDASLGQGAMSKIELRTHQLGSKPSRSRIKITRRCMMNGCFDYGKWLSSRHGADWEKSSSDKENILLSTEQSLSAFSIMLEAHCRQELPKYKAKSDFPVVSLYWCGELKTSAVNRRTVTAALVPGDTF